MQNGGHYARTECIGHQNVAIPSGIVSFVHFFFYKEEFVELLYVAKFFLCHAFQDFWAVPLAMS